MDPQYELVYQDLYLLRPLLGPSDRPPYPYFQQTPQLIQDAESVRKAIDAAESELAASRQQTLRADARYFLLLNLMEMIFVPVRAVEVRRGRSEMAQEVQSYLHEDLRLLVNDAARLQTERQQGEAGPGQSPEAQISGHSVLESIAANWRRLRLSSIRVWGEQ